MPTTIHDITERIRNKAGSIYDMQCKLIKKHDTVYAHIIHTSPLNQERVFVPILIPWRWSTISSDLDLNEIAGWGYRAYNDLPSDHTYGNNSIYTPDQATCIRLFTPGEKDNSSIDHELLQLLYELFVDDSRRGITSLSIFMSLEIEKDQLLVRLNYFQDRELISTSDSDDDLWRRSYSISAEGIKEIENQIQLKAPFESRYFREVDIEHSGDFIFVIMPFKEEELDQTIYTDSIYPIVKSELSIDCVRVDDDNIPDRIDNKIFTYIKNAKFLIAELTTNNANVIYELAMAHMLNKRAIILTQNNPPDLPFDFDKFPAIIYSTKEELKDILPDILKSTIEHS